MSYLSAITADTPLHLYALQETSGTTAADTGTSATLSAGTYVNSVNLDQPGVENPAVVDDAAVKFNTAYVSIPDVADLRITGDLTLEMWVKPLNFTNFQELIAKTTGTGGSNSYYEWRIDQTTGNLTFKANAALLTSTGPVYLGIWNHVAVKRSGTTVTHYLNGVPNGSGTVAVPTATSTTPVRIGTRDELLTPAVYTASYAAIYNSALSDAKIAAHFAATSLLPSKLNVASASVDALIYQATARTLVASVASDVLIIPSAPAAQIASVAIDVLRPVTAPSTGAVSYKAIPIST